MQFSLSPKPQRHAQPQQQQQRHKTLLVMIQQWFMISYCLFILATITSSSTNTKCFALSSAATVLKDSSRVLAKMEEKKEDASKRPQVAFSHVHLYVDELKDLETYKDLEGRLNSFVKDCKAPLGQDISTQRDLWQSKHQPDHFDKTDATAAFVPQNRDLVQQLLSGFGFRVTGASTGTHTRSVLVTSKDRSGVQFLLTSKEAAGTSSGDENYNHFDAGMYRLSCTRVS